jgi:hypothetical protein
MLDLNLKVNFPIGAGQLGFDLPLTDENHLGENGNLMKL